MKKSQSDRVSLNTRPNLHLDLSSITNTNTPTNQPATLPTEIILKVKSDTITRLMRVTSDTNVTKFKALVITKLLLDEPVEEVLYMPLSGIYLTQSNRTLSSYNINKGDSITLKKLESPCRTVTVSIPEHNQQQEIGIWKDTTVMGLIQLIGNKEPAMSKYYLSSDGKTSLPMEEGLSKSSLFLFGPYPPPLRDGSSARILERSLTVRTDSQLLISPRITSRVNAENGPAFFKEKKWRTISVPENIFIHLNRVFLPPLECITNLPATLNVVVPPNGELKSPRRTENLL